MSNHKDELDKMIIEVIESAHADSLSDNPQIAIVGRARKAMLESALRWMDEEEARGTDLGEMVAATAYYAGGVVAKIAVSLRDAAPRGMTAPSNDKLAEIFRDALNRESVTALETIENEFKKKLASLP